MSALTGGYGVGGRGSGGASICCSVVGGTTIGRSTLVCSPELRMVVSSSDGAPIAVSAPNAGSIRERLSKRARWRVSPPPMKPGGPDVRRPEHGVDQSEVVAAAAVSDGGYTLFVADFSDTDTAWQAYEALKSVEDGRSVEIEGVAPTRWRPGSTPSNKGKSRSRPRRARGTGPARLPACRPPAADAPSVPRRRS